MENMANRECCDVDIRDYYTNAPIMLIDFCNANTAEFSSDSITVRRNGVKFLRFDSPIESTISITFQVHPFYIYRKFQNSHEMPDGSTLHTAQIFSHSAPFSPLPIPFLPGSSFPRVLHSKKSADLPVQVWTHKTLQETVPIH